MNDLFNSLNLALASSANSILIGIIQFLPNFFGAILTFIVGIIIAGWAKTLVIKLLKTLQFPKLTSSKSVQKFLSQAQITQTIESILGQLVKGLIILIFSVAAINLLGLSTVTQVLTRILAYIPSVAAAVIIFVVGVIIAGIVEKLVKGSLGSIDLKIARGVGKLASYLVVVFSSLAALSQLGIAENFVNTIFIGFIAMLALGLGLSLGLGSKDLVRTILENWYKNIKKDIK